MAQQVTADALLLGIYKRWYTEKRFPNLLFRNSPLLRKIQKNRIGGRTYQIAMLYGRGGNTSGDYTRAVALAASASRNAEMAITPGNVFTVFNVTQKEILAANDKKGGYVKALINRMFAATEGTRKALAGCLYGFGYGDVGALPVAVPNLAVTAVLNYDTIVKLDVGCGFYVVNGGTPAAAYWDATLRTISAIDGNTITWTGGASTGWNAGDLIEIDGGRDAGLLPNMPTGLAAWLPSVANRTGAVWTTYIGTAFYGVTRSVSVNALSGWFYQRTPGQAKVDALVQGIKLARRGGGVPDIIVVNDDDFADIIEECNQQTTLFQAVNTAGAKNATNEVVRGIAKMRYSFSTSWLDKCLDDPYCPKGIAYILDSEVIEFAALSNAEPITNDGVSENEPGSATVESQSEPDTTFKLLIDDYISTAPNSTSVEGPAVQVSLSVYGNFVVHEPGHCAVVIF